MIMIKKKLVTILILMIMIMINISCFSVKICDGEVRKSDLISEIIPDPLYNVLPSSGKIDKDINDVFSHRHRSFTENFGQVANAEVLFYAQECSVWCTADGVWFELREYAETRGQGSQLRGQGGVRIGNGELGRGNWDSGLTTDDYRLTTNEYKRVVLKQEFEGANPVRPIGKDRLSWNSNFFLGNNPNKWCTNVPNYREIWFENIFEKIDLRYYINDMGLKYDFILCPGGVVDNIKLKYRGITKLELDINGDLIIQTPIMELRENKPYIYQNIDGQKNVINGEFYLINDYEYTFKISDNYNKNYPLIIDPLLEYSTFLGAGSTDNGYGICVDKFGNAYATGKTYSSTFPTTPGAYDRQKSSNYDLFISKFNHNGSSLMYSTYIGGDNNDYGYDIEVDTMGETYITGSTKSSDFPTTTNAYDTSKGSGYAPFAVKLNVNGSKLIYSTFVHGTGSSLDEGRSIAIDPYGNAYIAGVTDSTDFDTTTGAFSTTINGLDDGFVFKLNETGQKLEYSTYIGGSGDDGCFGVTVDIYGNAYVTGETASNDFPNTTGVVDNYLNGSIDAFILKINQTGKSLLYSTYIGGSSYDHGYSIAVDSKGNAVITGETTSTDFTTTPGVKDRSHNGNLDVFVLEINQTGQKLVFSTFIGGSSIDCGKSLDLDSAGNVYVTGYSVSSNFPTTPDCYNNILNGYDIFLLKLSNDGSEILYSTFIGGSLTDHGESIAIDPFGGAYVVGSISSSNFPTTAGAYDTSYTGNWDGVVFKFSFKPRLGITSLELIKNKMVTSTAYARYGIYTFKVYIIHTGNSTDLNNVHLYLDPTGSNIHLHWNKSSGLFTKTNDPENYLTLEPTCKIYNRLVMWIVDFNVTFNWNYPTEEYQDIQTTATSTSLPTAWFNATGFFNVENDLGFHGELLVRDENNQKLSNNDTVSGETEIRFSGLKVVYDNTTNVYPPENIYNISLSDKFGMFWKFSPSQGEEIDIKITLPRITIYENYTLKLSLTDVPSECISGFRCIVLRLDSGNVTFEIINPKSTTWNRASNVLVEVNISDIGGSMVDGKNIERAISTDNGTSWTDWVNLPNMKSEVHMIIREKITFSEGAENLIKWQASDLVGNGPTESIGHRILIDTEEVSFSNSWPANDDVSKTESVEFGITITDKTSGVNASGIQYSISFNKGYTWSAWKNVTGLSDGYKVNIHINDTFPNGTNNMLKWRAFDIAGNGPSTSTIFLINVNTWQDVIRPNVILVSPPSGLKINSTNVTLFWELEDIKFDGVIYDIYFDTESPPALYYSNYNGTTLLQTGLEDDKTYYWRVIPKVGDINGSCLGGIWWFEIKLEQSIPDRKFNISIAGIDSVSLYPGEEKRIELIITNNDKIGVFLDLKLEAGEMLRFVFLEDDSSLYLTFNDFRTRNLDIQLPRTAKPGIYQILVKIVTADSEQLVLAHHEITVEILELKEPNNNGTGPPIVTENGTKDNKTNDDLSLSIFDIILYSSITVILIIIFILIGFVLISKRRKLMEENIEHLGGNTIKPGTHQAKVLTIGQPTPIWSPTGPIGPIPVHRQQPQVQPPKPIQAQVPMVRSKPQAQAQLQMPQAIQKPQLPPADKNSMDDK